MLRKARDRFLVNLCGRFEKVTNRNAGPTIPGLVHKSLRQRRPRLHDVGDGVALTRSGLGLVSLSCALTLLVAPVPDQA